MNSHLVAQIEKRKKQALQKPRETDDEARITEAMFDQEPVLTYPDFMDFQDFVNPIMRLDLTLEPS